MKSNYLKTILLAAATITLFSFELPKGWFKAGSNPNDYEMGIDKNVQQNGTNAATIKSIKIGIDGFGTLMQTCLPDKFFGEKVKMSGYIKSKDVAEWAGFWLRVDQNDGDQPLAFDNMQDRAVKGTTDWKKYEIILDVPANATNIAYGALLSGEGQIWFDDIKFEIVDNATPVTGDAGIPNSGPVNTDFEE
ncbi:MAG: hypothetical protein IPJ81_13585 [Chitinophagaceae bacterium]|nr:hypothetical protein [Chitinophagaceae bacterium]